MSFEELEQKLKAIPGVVDVQLVDRKLSVNYLPNCDHNKITDMQLAVALAVSDAKLDVVFIDYIKAAVDAV
jgi:hypothetical protein